MIRVFIGGSRKITKLAPVVLTWVDDFMANNALVLIGDANGADKCIQAHLAGKNYRNVAVFCMGNSCRNNIGGWETRNITADTDRKDFRYYSIKDLRMAQEASFGFMVWDATSVGTLNNIINLLKEHKPAYVYFSLDKSVHTVRSFPELLKLLVRCDKGALERFEEKLTLSQLLKKEQPELEFA
jgi:hypothetical protein